MPQINELEHLDLTEDQRTRLVGFLDREIYKSESERDDFIDSLIEEIEAYEAPKNPPKSHPWKGASNLTVPVIGSQVDTIFPRLHATIFSTSNVITVEEWPGELAEASKAWEDALQWIMDNELDIKRVADSWFMEAIIHGTSVVKVTWEFIERIRHRYDNEGDIVDRDREILRNNPVLEHIGLEDFFIPFNAQSVEEAQWCAHRMRLSLGELRLLEFNEIYKNVDEIVASTKDDSEDYQAKREEITDTKPHDFRDDYDVFEVWLDFDLSGNGVEEPLLVTYHPDTQTILRAQPNPYDHGRKPFREIIYFPRHDRFYGMGLARQLIPIQEEISTIHNQRIDNSTIANTRMWVVVAGSRADQSFQGAAPGLKVQVDDQDEINALPMGDVGASQFEGEQVALRYAQQRSGVSDFLQGTDFGEKGGRQTATQSVMQMQEARTRFNWTLEQVRDAVEDVATIVTDLYEQFGAENAQDKFVEILGDEKGEMVASLLNGTIRPSRSNLLSGVMSLRVTASSASVNKQVEQQNLISLMTLLEQQTTNFEMPLVQIILNPNAPSEIKDYAMERIEGSRILMQRIMETFDVRNTTQVLGDTTDLRSVTEQDEQPGPGAVPQPGGAPGAPPGLGIPGMGAPQGAPPGPMGAGGQPAP